MRVGATGGPRSPQTRWVSSLDGVVVGVAPNSTKPCRKSMILPPSASRTRSSNEGCHADGGFRRRLGPVAAVLASGEMVRPRRVAVRVDAPVRDGAPARISISGEIDLASANEVRSQLRAARERYPGCDFILELAQVEFIDSTGLQVLLGFRKELRDDGTVMVLLGAAGDVLRIFEAVGLNNLLLLAASQKQAERMLAGLHAGPPPAPDT